MGGGLPGAEAPLHGAPPHLRVQAQGQESWERRSGRISYSCCKVEMQITYDKIHFLNCSAQWLLPYPQDCKHHRCLMAVSNCLTSEWWIVELFLYFGHDKLCCYRCVYKCLWGPMFSFLLGGYLEVELLSHKVTPCSGIWGTAWLSSKVAKLF